MTDEEFNAFLDLLMCSDPCPVPGGVGILISLANIESKKRGYGSWIDAYHRIHNHQIKENPTMDEQTDPVFNLGIGSAIHAMRQSRKVARKGWNGKDMFIFLVPGSNFKVSRPPLNVIYPEGTEISYQPHVDMKTVDGSIVPWLCSQSDLLAQDWGIVE